MQTKLAKLKAAAAAGNWEGAVAIAARFPSLGEEKTPIMQAHEAYKRPDFQRQIGRDPEALKAAGIEALKRRYGL